VQDLLKIESMSDHERTAMGQAGRAWLLQNTRKADWQSRFNDILDDVL
jgi:hypothetical protein